MLSDLGLQEGGNSSVQDAPRVVMAKPGVARATARSAGLRGSGQPQARRRQQQQQSQGQQRSASRPGQRRWVPSPGEDPVGSFSTYLSPGPRSAVC